MSEEIKAMENALIYIKKEKNDLYKKRTEIGTTLKQLNKLEIINKNILKILIKENGKSK